MKLSDFGFLVEKAKLYKDLFSDYQWCEGLEAFTKACGNEYSEKLIEYAYRLGRGETVYMPSVTTTEILRNFEEFKKLETNLVSALNELDQFVLDFQKAFEITEDFLKYLHNQHSDYKQKIFANGQITR